MSAINEILVGGNHLANFLIGKLGGSFSADFPPTCDPQIAMKSMPSDVYDVWVCWAAIMRAKFLAN